MTAGWVPSQHTIVAAGLAVAAVVLASAAVTHRDAWLTALRAHRHAVERAALAAVVVVVAAVAAAHLDDLEHLVERVEGGDPAWLATAVGFEIVSFGGYVVLTYIVHRPRAPRLDWISSTELTLAGVVATRVFSAGGAGGIAFTGWVLHRAGMTARVAARRLTAFMILLYSLYFAVLLVGGLLVVAGVLTGVPGLLGIAAALVGAVVALLALAVLRIPGDLERRVAEAARGSGRIARIAAKLAPVPEVAGNGARLALSIAREQPSVLVWSAVWWAFDIATLWGVLPRVRRRAGDQHDRALLLPRPVGKPAAAARRRGRYRGRDGGRVRRVGRGRRARARGRRRLSADLDLPAGTAGHRGLRRSAPPDAAVGHGVSRAGGGALAVELGAPRRFGAGPGTRWAATRQAKGVASMSGSPCPSSARPSPHERQWARKAPMNASPAPRPSVETRPR